MKNFNKVIAAAVSTLMLTACHNEDVIPGGASIQDMARFSATIAGSPGE